MKTIFLTKEQKDIIKNSITESGGNSMLLNEENSTVKKKVKDVIRQYCNPHLAQFLDTPLNELPYMLKSQLNPGGNETAMWRSVSNNPTENKFIDFLKINIYDQLGTKRDRGPWEYVVGGARILCQDLGFYSFDPNVMQGGNIIKFAKLLKIIHNNKEFFIGNGPDMDRNLNGMNYRDFMNAFSEKYNRWREELILKLSSENIISDNSYTIVPIEDRYNGNGCIPTGDGRRLLNSLDNYTDWCICGNMQDFEYPQYTGGGGKVYIMLKNGYQGIQKEIGEGCPLDEYGLSLICVIVGPDGLPDNITTRWNHENGGENPEGLSTALDLQNVTKVKYLDVFKPRSNAELSQMHMLEESKTPSAQDQVHGKVNAGIMDGITGCGAFEEGAEPESDKYVIAGEGGNNENFHVISEDEKKHDDWFVKYIKPIAEFMKENGLNVKPYPKVKLNWEDQDGLFIKTGYYEPSSKTIVLFCKDRHPKDILRTFSHEMIHHSQNLDGKSLEFSEKDDVKGNEELEKIESEAYLKGNIFFRKWTEYVKGDEKILNESKFDKNLYNLINEIQMEDTNPDDVDLSSFNIKKNLNPKFWKNGRLDSRIRMKLLDLADDFMEFMGVDWVKPDDIIMTGSLANFNWNEKYSDIDLHIVMDFSKVDDRTDFVDNYFYSQKKLWNDEHKDLKIFGFPVEVFVQDSNAEHSSTGVYSLEKDEWIVEPDREQLASSKVDKSFIKKRVAKYIDKIDNLEKHYKRSKGDEYKIRKISEKSDELFDKLKSERRKSLGDAENEITEGNIVFKCLRRLGYIEKLVNLMSKSYDALNSINESSEGKTDVYMMVGIPGAGKSTWIKNNHPELPVVSRDLIRVELGYCGEGEKINGTKEQEEEVTKKEYNKMYKLLKEKRSFVIDDTNSNERFRSKLVSFLRRNGANIICVLLKTPLDVCKDRRNGQIPQEVMDKLHRKFAEPKDNEYDEIIVV